MGVDGLDGTPHATSQQMGDGFQLRELKLSPRVACSSLPPAHLGVSREAFRFSRAFSPVWRGSRCSHKALHPLVLFGSESSEIVLVFALGDCILVDSRLERLTVSTARFNRPVTLLLSRSVIN